MLMHERMGAREMTVDWDSSICYGRFVWCAIRTRHVVVGEWAHVTGSRLCG